MIGTPAPAVAWVKRPPFVRGHLVIWRNGGPWERFFLVLGVFTYLFLPLAILWMFWLVLTDGFPPPALLSFALAVPIYSAFHEAMSNGVINARVWRYYIEEGRLRPHEQYFSEWVRFLENDGDRGLFPGAVRWTLAFWGVYYGILIASVALGLVLAPTFDFAAPFVTAALDCLIVLPCWIAWQSHKRRVGRVIDRKGYKLKAYAEAAGWTSASRSEAAFKLVPTNKREILALLGALTVLALGIVIAYAVIAGWIR